MKASAKWATRSKAFKQMLDRKRGFSDEPAEVVDEGKKELPSTEESRRRRRLRSLRGRKLQIVEDEPITVRDFARGCAAQVDDIIAVLSELGEAAVSPTTELNAQEAELLAEELDMSVTLIDPDRRDVERTTVEDKDVLTSFPRRTAVVTVMGHVDHGKTTLIDWLRRSNVAGHEKGGITQSIGSFLVRATFDGRTESFCVIDTPGHEAFSQMRERGANVTDIVLLVVAADDGPLQTTVEAIRQAKRARATVIAVINKIDLPNANIRSAKEKLAECGVVVEEFGGNVQCVEVSALRGTGMEQLVETVMLEAEVLDLHASRDDRGEAVCLESKLDKHFGPVCNSIVRWGTLRRGDHIVAGMAHGRVRVMFDDAGKQINEARPSTPVAIAGLDQVAEAGSDIIAVKDEGQSKAVIRARANKRALFLSQKTDEAVPIEERMLAEEIRTRHAILLVKADVQGSLDAILLSIDRLRRNGLGIYIVHSGVGDVTHKDAALAVTSDAIILAFNVRTDREARAWFRKYQRDEKLIRSHDIIYRLLEDVEKICRIKTQEKFEEVQHGRATIAKIFELKGKKPEYVYGCHVNSGTISLNSKVRARRNEDVVYEGSVTTIKSFKDNVTKVPAGSECGLRLADAKELKPGDIIEAYEVREREQETL